MSLALNNWAQEATKVVCHVKVRERSQVYQSLLKVDAQDAHIAVKESGNLCVICLNLF